MLGILVDHLISFLGIGYYILVYGIGVLAMVFSLLWCLFWLLNSAFKMYPVAFLNDFLSTVSTIVSLIRYRKKKS